MVIARPGNTEGHHSPRMSCEAPVEIIRPHSGVGGRTPAPTKLRPAVRMMAKPIVTEVCTSEGTIDGQTVTLPTVPALAPKAAVTYKIVCKGVTAGDAHTVFKLSSDVLSSPITAEESTHVY